MPSEPMISEPSTVSGPRERILAAAKEVFANRGFRGGSLNDIAVTVGLTRAGVLHYFPTKEAVLLALLEQRDLELGEYQPREVSIFTLLAELDSTVTVILGDRQLVQLSHILTAEASGGDHPAHDWVAERYRRLRLSLGTALRHSIDTGELDPDLDVDVVAALLLGVFEGAENQWLIDPDAVSPAAVIETMRTILRASAR